MTVRYHYAVRKKRRSKPSNLQGIWHAPSTSSGSFYCCIMLAGIDYKKGVAVDGKVCSLISFSILGAIF